MKETALSADSVRALATEESFARGRDYARHGAVLGLQRRGNRLIAEVEGSEYEPYAIAVELCEDGIAATRCSCPYDWGGVCKHVVAVLLKYIEAPGAVEQRPSLDDMLGNLEREALVALMVKRADEDASLALWLEAELASGAGNNGLACACRTAIDPEPIRRQAEALLSGRHRRKHRWDHEDGLVDEEAFGALVDKAKPFLAGGDGRNALNILVPVTEALVPVWYEQADWDETLHEFFPILGQMIAEAVLMSDLSPEERDDLMLRLDVWQGTLDEYGLDEALQVGLDALDQGWDEIGLDDVLAGKARSWPLSGSSDGAALRLTEARLRVLDIRGRTPEYLHLAKAAGRHGDHAAMLVRLERIAEAVEHARKRFHSAEEVLQLSLVLHKAGQIDPAFDLAAWGLRLKAEHSHVSGPVVLARWLRETAGLAGRREPALVAARQAFEASLSLEDFRAAERLAGSGWVELRLHLLASLAAAKYARDRTEIYLGEGMVEEAVRAREFEIMPGNPSDVILMRLAEAACASHPDWVIGVAERMADGIMEAGQSGLYELAAKWLEKAALAYEAAGRFEDWIVRLDRLIERHRRKHRLRPLLMALRPGAALWR